ncbi:unnamed protein product [Brugia pahangi]|uniref:Wiskott-Aldrich syndrome protein family member n=1 Tax=Brugia pahangi TaxID=6280 RepID=A0A0N4T6S5_BRUPA|nr:unnamed protein product [Brugia pahangi]
MKKYYEHSVKPSAQLNQSVKCPKLYGIVEFEIEVTELLENISIALHYLQKTDLLCATNNELQIFQNDIAALIVAVTNLKYKIQKAFKDITFQEDMHCLASSKESIHGLNSREIPDKTWRNIHQSKEFDETQNDSMIFHRRFAAGSCILQKKIRHNDKKQKSRKTDPVLFEKKINQHFGQIGSKLKQLAKLPSYDVSYNSEILLSSNERNV